MIKTLVKEAVSKLFYNSEVFKKFQKRKKTPVPLVLYYHRVHERPNPLNRIPSLSIDVSQFEAQIRFLREKFHVVSLYDVIRHYRNEIRLRPDSVAITFDDGFRDNYDLAFPILKKYDIPATIFVTTGFVGKSDLLWWDKIFVNLDVLGKNGLLGGLRSGIDEHLYLLFLRYYQARESKTVESIINQLKKRRFTKICESINLMEEILTRHGVAYEVHREFLSWDEIREMSTSGITFGSHSVSHCMLVGLDDNTLKSEIADSKATIEYHIGKCVNFFSYPDGVFDIEAKAMVKRSGYLGAFQTKRNSYIRTHDVYALGRIPMKEGHSSGINNRFSESVFTLELFGVYERVFFRRLRSKSPYEIAD